MANRPNILALASKISLESLTYTGITYKDPEYRILDPIVDDDMCSIMMRMRLEKNKVTPSDRRVGFYTLKYRTGIYVMKDLIDTAKELGYVQQSGSWYALIDPETQEWEKDAEGNPIRYQGIWKFYDFFWNHEDWFNYLNDTILEKLSEVKQ